MGIGLSFVKQLGEMHGGSVEARSDGDGKGSEFVVRLPVDLSVVGYEPFDEAAAVCTTARYRILVADDIRDAADSLALLLTIMGHETRTVHDGLEALDVTAAFRPEVTLLDMGMPKLDGFDVCRSIRRESDVPVIMLTARGDVMDRVIGLEIGADDYLPKPFEPRELLARVQTVLRRARVPVAVAVTTPKRLHFDGLTIDLERRQVTCMDAAVELTSTEFELLALLAGEPQKVFMRDEILNRLRGHDAELFTRAVDIVISRLRKKLEPLDCIKTLRNVGYTFAGARI